MLNRLLERITIGGIVTAIVAIYIGMLTAAVKHSDNPLIWASMFAVVCCLTALTAGRTLQCREAVPVSRR